MLENITLDIILPHLKTMAHAVMEGINKLLSVTIKEQSVHFGELLKIFTSLSEYPNIFLFWWLQSFFKNQSKSVLSPVHLGCLRYHRLHRLHSLPLILSPGNNLV